MLISNAIACIILIGIINMNTVITCIIIAIVYFFQMPLLALFLLVSLNMNTFIVCILITIANKHNVKQVLIASAFLLNNFFLLNIDQTFWSIRSSAWNYYYLCFSSLLVLLLLLLLLVLLFLFSYFHYYYHY